ncbi:MAG: hypothetical protein LAO78_01755 [Acidobacteriia bacterium]|nr:hypothetical protein [Terriglobia bacterium]
MHAFLFFLSVCSITRVDSWTIIGTFASVAGLALSLFVLHVAKGAKKAAEDAKVLAEKRNLAEELQQARRNIEQIGDYLNKREWMAVRIRAQEIMTSCRESLTRWPKGLSADRRNDILNASSLVNSIANEAAAPDVNDFRPAKLKRLSSTQLQVAELLSSALGEARNRAEDGK